jgi:small multidrug resistance pump
MARGYDFLIFAIFFEVCWAVNLKWTKGLSWSFETAVTLLAYILSLVSLDRACRELEIGVAYAVWTGLGTTAVAFFGIVLFREAFTLAKAVGFILVVAGVLTLLLGWDRSPV